MRYKNSVVIASLQHRHLDVDLDSGEISMQKIRQSVLVCEVLRFNEALHDIFYHFVTITRLLYIVNLFASFTTGIHVNRIVTATTVYVSKKRQIKLCSQFLMIIIINISMKKFEIFIKKKLTIVERSSCIMVHCTECMRYHKIRIFLNYS